MNSIVKAALTPEEFRGYCKGTMIKLVCSGTNEDILEASVYASRLLEADSELRIDNQARKLDAIFDESEEEINNIFARVLQTLEDLENGKQE